MIVLAVTLCIMASPVCRDVEYRDLFGSLDDCSAFADDATTRQSAIPPETLQLLRVKAVSCRDEQDS
jgi:hypothetical protein